VTRRSALGLAAIVIAITVIAAGTIVARRGETLIDSLLDFRYGRTLPQPHYPAPANEAEARLQDLDYLAGLPTVDRSFTGAAKARFEQRLAALREAAPALGFAQFAMGVAEAVAQSGNAHTNLDISVYRERLASAPVRLAWFADGLYVVRATTPHAALLGARVLAIHGIDVVALAGETARYLDGTAEHAHAASPLLLESPQALHVMHPEAPDDRLVLRIREAGAAERSVELPAADPAWAPRASRSGRVIAAEPLAGEKPGEWHTLLEARRAVPASLREPGRLHYTTHLGPRILYLHLWRVSVGFEPGVGDAIAAAAGRDDEPLLERIVLDLRFNDGGEYPTIYGAIRSLPKRLAPGGKLMILTNNHTFSGAIITAALAKHFAGDRAVVVGERAGDRLAFWAEGDSFTLPNSKLKVNIATGFHDWARGCRQLRCYWPNLVLGVAVDTIDPDIAVGWRFADYRNGVDTVLERALQ
jgi:hypothetical protein